MKAMFEYYNIQESEAIDSAFQWFTKALADMFGTREGEQVLDAVEKAGNPSKRLTSQDVDQAKKALSEYYKAQSARATALANKDEAMQIFDKLKDKATFMDTVKDWFGTRQGEKLLDNLERQTGGGTIQPGQYKEVSKASELMKKVTGSQASNAVKEHMSKFKDIVKNMTKS